MPNEVESLTAIPTRLRSNLKWREISLSLPILPSADESSKAGDELVRDSEIPCSRSFCLCSGGCECVRYSEFSELCDGKNSKAVNWSGMESRNENVQMKKKPPIWSTVPLFIRKIWRESGFLTLAARDFELEFAKMRRWRGEISLFAGFWLNESVSLRFPMISLV